MFVGIAIGSLLNQTFHNFEIIVINDGSTDNTVKCIKRFQDERIVYVELKQHMGYPLAINEGIDRARGNYIAFLNSNDIALKNRLKVQYNYLEKNIEFGGVGSNATIINESGSIIKIFNQSQSHELIKISLLKDIAVINSSLFVRRILLINNKIYFNTKNKYSSDFEFQIQCSEYFSIACINEPLIQSRLNISKTNIAINERNRSINELRLSQLKKFKTRLSIDNMNFYIKVMSGNILTEDDLEKGITFLNQLIKANHQLNLYDEENLFEFFKTIIIGNQSNLQLGGWSIDKEVISFIKQKIVKGSTILEFGSGIGTNHLLADYNVISIEHDPIFLVNRGLNHQCIYAPILSNWYDREIVKHILREKVNLIIVDGPPSHLRGGLLVNLDLFKKIETPVIFDDVNRPFDKEIMIQFCSVLGYTYSIYPGGSKLFAYCTKKIDNT